MGVRSRRAWGLWRRDSSREDVEGVHRSIGAMKKESSSSYLRCSGQGRVGGDAVPTKKIAQAGSTLDEALLSYW